MKKTLTKLQRTHYKRAFLSNITGSVIVSFAIMLPTIFICMLVSINYTQSMRTRAQISEATNEASLAIVAINNENTNTTAIEQNKKVALNYLNYYLNKAVSDNENDAYIDIQYNQTKREYYVTYRQTFDAVIDHQQLSESAKQTVISNKTESYGNTRKTYMSETFDVAFIADFSGSGSCPYNNYNCNDYVGTINDTQRLAYMKTAISSIIDEFKHYPEYRFALVPYDVGVPVVNNQINPAGGESYACSVMYKMNPPFDDIDYNFWANKNILYTKWSRLKENNIISDYLNYDYIGNYENPIFYYLDYYYYFYYAKIIGPALGYYNNQQLVDSGLCIFQNYIDQPNMGSAQYACGINNSDYPLNTNNRNIVRNQYAKIVQLYDYMFSGNYPNVHYSFANTQTVDVLGTIDTLFSQMNNNTITFNRSISPTVADFSPFQGMCQSPLYNNNIMSEKMVNLSYYQRFNEASKHVKSFSLSPYLIPFSDAEDHNVNLLNEIKRGEWRPGGGTDTITALLRTVPIMAKSNALNKVMIIITDGKDDVGADELREQFLENGACQAITNGLTSLANQKQGYIDKVAKSAVIHYIRLDPNASNLTTDSDYQAVYGSWYTQCMNNDKQFLHVATDYQSLLDAMRKIVISETGSFINKN